MDLFERFECEKAHKSNQWFVFDSAANQPSWLIKQLPIEKPGVKTSLVWQCYPVDQEEQIRDLPLIVFHSHTGGSEISSAKRAENGSFARVDLQIGPETMLTLD